MPADTSVYSNDAVTVKDKATCKSELKGYGSKGSTSASEGQSAERSIVPSRTLKLTIHSETHLEDKDLQEAFEKYGALHSLDASRDGYAYVRFYDLRDASAALSVRHAAGCEVVPMFAHDGEARDLDEEGRVVVRVEGHLGCNDLCHIFSTYGGVRNIQDVPNVNIHKVVEFFDVRSAAKAVDALNGVDGNCMHAASVAYLERTRCKLFLIPPRLPDAADFTDGLPGKKLPKTLPLGGATKPAISDLCFTNDVPVDWGVTHKPGVLSQGRSLARTHLFDSSSSLLDTIRSSTKSILQPIVGSPISTGFPSRNKTGSSADHSLNDGRNGLSIKEVLPSELGLYDDEEPENTCFQYIPSNEDNRKQSSRNCMFGLNPELDLGIPYPENGCSTGFSPLTSSFMETMARSENIPFFDGQMQDAPILSQYLEYEAHAFRQAVDFEVMKRLNSLKRFDGPTMGAPENPLHRYRTHEEWKAISRTQHKKKGSRFPRHSSATDLQQEAERRAQQEKMFAMDLERVRSGKDKRTTLMIKNIPNKYDQRMLLSRIEQEFKGTFDFFYLPIDFKNKCNVGYGFINMTSTEHIIAFVEHVHEQKWDKFNSDKVCCVTYARIQGRHALINHFQNSSLMAEDIKHQPLLFKPNGDPEPFPTKPLT